MKQFECVIFDWAGTTVDYGCFAPVQAFVEVFKHYGIEPTMEEVREPMGMLKIDHIRTMLNMPRIKKCWTEKYGKEPTEENVKELFGIFEEKLLSILHMFADPIPAQITEGYGKRTSPIHTKIIGIHPAIPAWIR